MFQYQDLSPSARGAELLVGHLLLALLLFYLLGPPFCKLMTGLPVCVCECAEFALVQRCFAMPQASSGSNSSSNIPINFTAASSLCQRFCIFTFTIYHLAISPFAFNGKFFLIAVDNLLLCRVITWRCDIYQSNAKLSERKLKDKTMSRNSKPKSIDFCGFYLTLYSVYIVYYCRELAVNLDLSWPHFCSYDSSSLVNPSLRGRHKRRRELCWGSCGSWTREIAFSCAGHVPSCAMAHKKCFTMANTKKKLLKQILHKKRAETQREKEREFGVGAV